MAMRKVSTFLLLTFVISSYSYYSMYIFGNEKDVALTFMWAPGIAAILTKVLHNEKINDLGWRLGERKYLLLGFFIPLLYATIIYTSVWLTGLGKFTPQPLYKLLILSTIGLVIACFTALGEEIGWRGFLFPELIKKTNFTKASIITGCIWAIWHFPMILFTGYNSDTPLIFHTFLFLISVIGFSFLTAWLRIKSGSIWPSVIWHGGHNLFIQQVFLSMTTYTSRTEYFVDDFGLGVFFSALVLGYFSWKNIMKKI